MCNQVKLMYAFPVRYRDEPKWVHIIILFAVVKSSLISSQNYLAGCVELVLNYTCADQSQKGKLKTGLRAHFKATDTTLNLFFTA